MGIDSMYVSLLRMFLQKRRQIASEIKSAIEGGDIQKAELLSHTLRGISGQIGATTLATDAQNLEQVLNNNGPRETIDSLLMKLEESSAELFRGLELQLPHIESADPRLDIQTGNWTRLKK
jgi:HPt (histidine-containing phosphotransfer) domain-containing protein